MDNCWRIRCLAGHQGTGCSGELALLRATHRRRQARREHAVGFRGGIHQTRRSRCGVSITRPRHLSHDGVFRNEMSGQRTWRLSSRAGPIIPRGSSLRHSLPNSGREPYESSRQRSSEGEKKPSRRTRPRGTSGRAHQPGPRRKTQMQAGPSNMPKRKLPKIACSVEG